MFVETYYITKLLFTLSPKPNNIGTCVPMSWWGN